jgi:hypothetical protein
MAENQRRNDIDEQEHEDEEKEDEGRTSPSAERKVEEARALCMLREAVRVDPGSRTGAQNETIRKWFQENMTSLFRDLSQKKMMDFAEHARYASFGPGEWITRQDDYADKFYITLTGTMEVFVRNYAQVNNRD